MLEASNVLKRAIRKLPDWWPTPLFGAAGGYLASLIGWPLPWIIGSLLAVIAVRCSGCMLQEVPRGRATGQWLIASAIGLHFTHDVMQQVLQHMGVILAGALGTLLLSLIGIFVLLRSGTDRATAFFASLPGGASEMVNLASRHAAHPGKVAAAHSTRLVWFSCRSKL
ncbi:AbrB family transcriptional regulator, partial [Stutzerimonas stutzeri]